MDTGVSIHDRPTGHPKSIEEALDPQVLDQPNPTSNHLSFRFFTYFVGGGNSVL